MPGEQVARWTEEGLAQLEQGRFEEALHSFEHPVSIASPGRESAAAWCLVGTALQFQGSLAEALDAANRALRLDAGPAAHWALQGVILLQMQWFAKAARAIRVAVERDPLHGSWWTSLGQALYGQRHYMRRPWPPMSAPSNSKPARPSHCMARSQRIALCAASTRRLPSLSTSNGSHPTTRTDGVHGALPCWGCTATRRRWPPMSVPSSSSLT
jgi:tetratricopeptide (TPR) repeat protein